MSFVLAQAQAGDALPELAIPPLTRRTLALYAGGSGDHVAIHIDSDAAKAAGLGDVIGHGMLSMAWVGRLLTAHVPPAAIRSFQSRFVSPTRIGEAFTCSGRVAERFEEGGRAWLRLSLSATKADGTPAVTGEAVVAADGAPA